MIIKLPKKLYTLLYIFMIFVLFVSNFCSFGGVIPQRSGAKLRFSPKLIKYSADFFEPKTVLRAFCCALQS